MKQQTVLFICLGNTCRSPMAEGLLKSENRPGITVRSAGIAASEGSHVTQASVDALFGYGIDISSHRAHLVTESDLDDADVIITLEPSYAAYLKSIYPLPASKQLLSLSIPDPYGGDYDLYVRTAQEISRQIDDLLPDVRTSDENDLSAIARYEADVFSEPLSEKSLKDICASENGLLFGLYREGKLVSYIVGTRALDEVQILSVGSLRRGHGYATKLMSRFLDHAKANVIARVFLEVRVSNAPAIALYEKTGFVRDGVRKNLYRFPAEDGIIMHKDLI